MLTFESSKRISANSMLLHPFFADIRIESSKGKKDRDLSVKPDLQTKRKRESSL